MTSDTNAGRTSIASDVLHHYPLPIAHEYGQLQELHASQNWWDRCQQLRDVLDYSLRYAALIALSEDRRLRAEQSSRESAENLDWESSLVDALVEPKPEHLYRLLQMMVARYRGHQNLWVVPQLYDFCCTSEGTSTESMRRIERLLDGFVAAIDEQQVQRGDANGLRELYQMHERPVERLLQDLAFLKDYALVRVDAAWPAKNGGYVWSVKVLMGHKLPMETENWEGMPPVAGGCVLLWDRKTSSLLKLHPFALFDACEECSKAFDKQVNELFFYEKAWTEHNKIQYVGLREDREGLTHRIETGDTWNDIRADIRLALRVEVWPPGIRQAEEAKPAKMDWRRYRGLAETQSRDQLERYGDEKYKSSLYLQREMVESEFREFLSGEKNGFLVVGGSGTGKTSLLCYWVDSLLKGGQDVVLFYNCAELPPDLAPGGELNLGSLIGQKLGKHADFDDLLRSLEEVRGSGTGRFVLVLDALNEHQAPERLLESLWEDILSQVPAGMYNWFKVVVSCRAEAWQRLEKYFRGIGQFHRTADGIEVRLLQFTDEELPAVYEKYRKDYDLQNSFNQLTKAAIRFIADPLMLRFVAEGYQGEKVPPDPRSMDIFDRYYMEKLGKSDNPEMDRPENDVVQRLVELMYQAKTNELSERDLLDDDKIGQAVRASHLVNSPYFRLLDKGILTRIKVGRAEYGAAALFGGALAEPETRVRFTYDRFFEYLLALRVLPGSVTAERVRELSIEAAHAGYASLWGALKMRLIAYAEKEPVALRARGVLGQLAQESDPQIQSADEQTAEEGYWLWRTAVKHEVRGLLVDTLVSYGAIQPQKAQDFLIHELLKLDVEPAGLVAVFAAHRLRLPLVFQEAYAHSSHIVRETAIQHTYFYWSRNREQGEQYLSELAKSASRLAFRKKVTSTLMRDEFDLKTMPIPGAFLDTTLLIAGYFLTEPMAVRRFAQNILDLYDGFGIVKQRAVDYTKRWAGNRLIELWREGGVVNTETLSVFTSRPLDDAWRKKVREFVPYVGLDPRPIEEMADSLMEWSLQKDGVVSLVLVGILTNRSIHEPVATLSLLKRMFYDGNAMSQYNVVRTMSSVLQQDLDPCPGYLKFFNEALLDIFDGSQTTVEIKGKEYGLGHLGWGLTFECQRREHGSIEFVDQLLAQPWHGDPLDRLIHVIDELGTVGINAFKLAAVKPYPVLQTLSQWFHPEGMVLEDAERVQDAVARALARIWRAYPAEVEAWLETEPEMMMRMYETLEREPHGGMTNAGAQGMTAIVFMPPALPGLVSTVQKICDEVTAVDKAINMLGEFFLEPDTMERLAAWKVNQP